MTAFTRTEYMTLASMPVSRWRGVSERLHVDDIAEEVPVALEYNGISHAVMLASPADLEHFALGFSLSEGIVQSRGEIFECDVVETALGIRVSMRIASERMAALKERRRNLTGRTGCGLCGTESLQHAVRTPPKVKSNVVFGADELDAAFLHMERVQNLQRRTGATHAAAWLGMGRGIQDVREDVGRHNALDKLIGAMSRKQIDFSSGAALITSRASYEMVQKAAMLGIGFLAAVSAPTALAVRLADAAGMTMVGFARREGHVVYTHPERLIHSECSQTT